LKSTLLAALVLACAPLLFADPPTIQIPRIDTPPTLAEFETMQPDPQVAARMRKVTGFIVRDPADGAVPSQDTDVYLAYDDHNLYAVFIC
jgi:hypothetical protein